MKYWLTTHWPPRKGYAHAVGAFSDDDPYVWLPDGKEAAGAGLARDDLVLVYETRSGRTEVRRSPDGSTKTFPCLRGKGGIIYYGCVTSGLSTFPGSKPEQYADGSSIWWRWRAPLTVLSRSGFVPRRDVAIALGFKPDYPFHGFGTLQSGLKEISEAQYQDLVGRFHASQPVELPTFQVPHRGGPGGDGGEGDTHLFLKAYVAEDPAVALGEQGLRTQSVEYQFPTGDRADVVLTDARCRVVAVEVEPAVGNSDIVGPLQAIKYRYMLEWVARRARGDSRAFLVAHSIDADVKKLCDSYAIECFEIDRGRVDAWRRSRP